MSVFEGVRVLEPANLCFETLAMNRQSRRALLRSEVVVRSEHNQRISEDIGSKIEKWNTDEHKRQDNESGGEDELPMTKAVSDMPRTARSVSR